MKRYIQHQGYDGGFTDHLTENTLQLHWLPPKGVLQGQHKNMDLLFVNPRMVMNR